MARLGLTRQGLAILAAGVAAVAIGRVFGIIELFVIAAACFASVVVALGYVWTRRPRVEATRWIHPSLIVAGDSCQVDIQLRHRGRVRSAPFQLEDPVAHTTSEDHVARLPVAALPSGSTSSSGYRVPAASRGIVTLGPLQMIVGDALGLARSTTSIVGTDDIVVAPRTVTLDMPQLGRGTLGGALLDSARRLGPGDFHGLREYATGDEPRSIHWRASARTDELMVKQNAVEGLHRCTVVFDPDPTTHASTAGFERGVTAAASLVHSAMRAGLATRFVTAGGIDLRGPEVVANTLRVLARVEPNVAALTALDADMVDGLVLLVVVTGTRQGAAWRAAQAVADPTITRVLVTTNDVPASRLAVAARSDDEFISNWQSLVGRTITTPAVPAAAITSTAATATAGRPS